MFHAKVAFALFALGGSLLAADAASGTWKLNPAKSKYSPGPAPASATVTYEEKNNGIKRTGQTVEADGRKTAFEYTAKYDGKDYPVTGSDLFDTISLKKINDRTVTATLKKSGNVVRSARRVVSADGKTLTITITGTDDKGTVYKSVSVYDKQ